MVLVVATKDGLGIELSAESMELYRYLDASPRLLDEIVKELKLPAQKVLTVLSSLELDGVIERRLDERYGAKAVHRV